MAKEKAEGQTEEVLAGTQVVEQVTYLTREQLLAVQDIVTEDFFIPEWGGWIKIRGLTNGELARIMKLSTGRDGKLDTMLSALYTFRYALVEPKLQDVDIDDLKKKSALLLRIVKDINRVSGMGDEAVSEAEKN